jgi:hypothetical protein
MKQCKCEWKKEAERLRTALLRISQAKADGLDVWRDSEVLERAIRLAQMTVGEHR